MKIVIENLSDQETVTHSLLLIRGRVENLDTASVLRNEDDARLFLTHVVTPGSSTREQLHSIPIYPWGETKAKFKLLVVLQRGKNSLTFEFFRIRRILSICFQPPMPQHPLHVVKLLYIVPSGSDGSFQSPPGVKNDVESAQKRISLAGALIQSILAESMEIHGFGRKTIQFHSTLGTSFLPETVVFRSKLTMNQVHAMSQTELWNIHAEEVVAAAEKEQSQCQKIKYLAIHSATR